MEYFHTLSTIISTASIVISKSDSSSRANTISFNCNVNDEVTILINIPNFLFNNHILCKTELTWHICCIYTSKHIMVRSMSLVNSNKSVLHHTYYLLKKEIQYRLYTFQKYFFNNILRNTIEQLSCILYMIYHIWNKF